MVRRDVEAGGRRRKSRGALTSRPEVERLLNAATAAASPRELAGEDAAVDAFHRARLVSLSSTLGSREMSPTRSARTGLKAAIAAAGAVGLLSTGVAFAASGHAPWSGGHAAAASTHAVEPTHPTHPTHPAESGDPSDGTSQSTGPNAHAFPGLCRAYVSGNKTEHGQALASPAFAALVTAAGGVDNVATFCGTLTSGPANGHPTHPAKPTQAASPTHPAKPTEAASPTHPAKPTEAASPSTPATPTHPARPTDKPSNTTHPSH